MTDRTLRFSQMNIDQISASLKADPKAEVIEICLQDSRKAVRSLGEKYAKLNQMEMAEQTRIAALLVEENKLYKQGLSLVAGIDEAGRGPLAGPVFAAVCILPPKFSLPYLNDSKQLTEARREKLFDLIQKEAVAWAIGRADPEEIDAINILQATKQAMKRAVEGLNLVPDYLLIDALELPDLPIPQSPLIRGDCLSANIAAASILAKVTRDHWMDAQHKLYPQYGFVRNKGYGTKEHMAALQEFGPCPIHRRSFAPVSQAV